MADPVVGITNGVPTSGTGTITTLGITIPPAGTTTSTVQGGPMSQGAVTTTAPSYTTATVNALSLTTVGALRVDGSGVTQPVSGTFWQATQPVSGTVTANQGGTWTVQPGNTANTTAWLVTGTGGTFPVTGTFWQATQPISAASLPLPTGAATAAGQPTAAGAGSTSSGQTGNVAMGFTTTGAPTYTTAQTNPLSLTTTGALRVDGSGVTQTVSLASPANVRTFGGNGNATDFVGQNAGGTVNATLAGGQYNSTPTAITSGNASPLQVDTRGRLLVGNSLRANKGVQKTSITVATETTVLTAGAVGVFQDVYAIVVTNKSATSVFVDFKDATAGTTRLTLAAPAGDTRGFTVTSDSSMVQAVAANNWTATVSSAVTSIEITMLFVSNVA